MNMNTILRLPKTWPNAGTDKTGTCQWSGYERPYLVVTVARLAAHAIHGPDRPCTEATLEVQDKHERVPLAAVIVTGHDFPLERAIALVEEVAVAAGLVLPREEEKA